MYPNTDRTHRNSGGLHLPEPGAPPALQNQQSGVQFPHRQFPVVQMVGGRHQQIDHVLRLQRPDVLDCLPQLVIGLIHFIRYQQPQSNFPKTSNYPQHLPDLIFMFKFSRIKANRVLVKFTLPSSSTGMFIRINFLYARRFGHLLPKPRGGSMFFSISYIST